MGVQKVSKTSDPLLAVKNLKKYFAVKKGIFRKTSGYVKAVDDVSLSVNKGKTLGIVGESGCGKSTLARVIVRLLEASAGEVYFADKNVFALKGASELRQFRRDVQIIFQDPYASLNPRMTVARAINEVLEVHGLVAKAGEGKKQVQALLEMVDLSARDLEKYPHEFSGGQRQRIGIARALSVKPKLVICDEPVSALDVSIQAQILNLMDRLKEEFELTYIFISHDLGVVKHISDQVAVMYLGQIVELTETGRLFAKPAHPYTEALLGAIPIPDPDIKRQPVIFGDVPSPVNVPPGCRFHPRCSRKKEICLQKAPPFQELEQGHWVACHLYNS